MTLLTLLIGMILGSSLQKWASSRPKPFKKEVFGPWAEDRYCRKCQCSAKPGEMECVNGCTPRVTSLRRWRQVWSTGNKVHYQIINTPDQTDPSYVSAGVMRNLGIRI